MFLLTHGGSIFVLSFGYFRLILAMSGATTKGLRTNVFFSELDYRRRIWR